MAPSPCSPRFFAHSLTRRLALACAANALTTTLAMLIGFFAAGVSSSLAALLAGLTCLNTSIISLTVTSLQVGRDMAFAKVATAMMIRMSLPLIMLIVINFQAPALLEHGFVFFLLALYMPLLAVETSISIAQVGLDTNLTHG